MSDSSATNDNTTIPIDDVKRFLAAARAADPTCEANANRIERNIRYTFDRRMPVFNVIILAIRAEWDAPIVFLAKQNVNLNLVDPDSNSTPLAYAIECHSVRMMKVLLENGADPNFFDKDCRPCIIKVLQQSWHAKTVEMVRTLLDHGSKTSFIMGHRNLIAGCEANAYSEIKFIDCLPENASIIQSGVKTYQETVWLFIGIKGIHFGAIFGELFDVFVKSAVFDPCDPSYQTQISLARFRVKTTTGDLVQAARVNNTFIDFENTRLASLVVCMLLEPPKPKEADSAEFNLLRALHKDFDLMEHICKVVLDG